MDTVSIRDLRNKGGEVIDRIARGEAITVTRDGKPVAELRPVSVQPLDAQTLMDRWRYVPRVDGDALRADLDAALDPAL